MVPVRRIAAKLRFPPTRSEARGVYAAMGMWTEVRRFPATRGAEDAPRTEVVVYWLRRGAGASWANSLRQRKSKGESDNSCVVDVDDEAPASSTPSLPNA